LGSKKLGKTAPGYVPTDPGRGHHWKLDLGYLRKSKPSRRSAGGGNENFNCSPSRRNTCGNLNHSKYVAGRGELKKKEKTSGTSTCLDPKSAAGDAGNVKSRSLPRQPGEDVPRAGGLDSATHLTVHPASKSLSGRRRWGVPLSGG